MYRHKITFLLILTLCAGLLSAVSGTASAAGELDLAGTGSSGLINDAWFVQGSRQTPTGTGYIMPFLRIQKTDIEQGYNTDYSPHELREADSVWTKSLLLTAVPTVVRDTIVYREFLLDAHESQKDSNEYIVLDKLQIFLGSAGDYTGYPGSFGTPIWDMPKDSSVKIHTALVPGSGGGFDMSVLIPNSLFSGNNPYVYLYSQFSESDATFEEWAVHSATPPQAVPEPVTMLGFATPLGLLALGKIRQRFSK